MPGRAVFAFALLGWLGIMASCAALLLTLPAHQINEEHFQKLEVGMTRAEVESLFGVPPGDYDDGPNDFFDHRSWERRQADWAPVNGSAPTDWGSNGFIAYVWFDENGKVSYYTCVKWTPASRGLLERIGHRFRL